MEIAASADPLDTIWPLVDKACAVFVGGKRLRKGNGRSRIMQSTCGCDVIPVKMAKDRLTKFS
jgi:hypothetical protein